MMEKRPSKLGNLLATVSAADIVALLTAILGAAGVVLALDTDTRMISAFILGYGLGRLRFGRAG